MDPMFPFVNKCGFFNLFLRSVLTFFLGRAYLFLAQLILLFVSVRWNFFFHYILFFPVWLGNWGPCGSYPFLIFLLGTLPYTFQPVGIHVSAGP